MESGLHQLRDCFVHILVHQCIRLQLLSKLAAFVLVFLEFAVLHVFLLQLAMSGGSITGCWIHPIQLPLVAVGSEANVKHLQNK